MAYDWYPRGWWNQAEVDDEMDCDTEQLQNFLERAISLRRYPAPDESKSTDAGIVSSKNHSIKGTITSIAQDLLVIQVHCMP